jgi:hypothetical protein
MIRFQLAQLAQIFFRTVTSKEAKEGNDTDVFCTNTSKEAKRENDAALTTNQVWHRSHHQSSSPLSFPISVPLLFYLLPQPFFSLSLSLYSCADSNDGSSLSLLLRFTYVFAHLNEPRA